MASECVFCGEALGEGTPIVGRPPHAAHAACADAALADDAHWDAVATASGLDDRAGDEVPPAEDPPRATARGAGCATISSVVVASAAAILWALRRAPAEAGALSSRESRAD